MHEYQISRDSRGNLNAVTRVPFGTQRREVLISTRKHYRGGLICDATVSQLSEDGAVRTHAMGFGAPGGDYDRVLARVPDKRATRNAVVKLHKEMLAAAYETVMADVDLYYAKKEAA